MKVLVACEYSGRVRDEFIKQGHDAMSCDLLPTDSPGPHYQGDVRDLLGNGWDLMVAHPPCTYLSVSGMHWTKRGLRDPRLTEEALDFVSELLSAPVERIALENPISVISSRIRKPDQVISPHQFGHDASKKTCLWLKNLPPLRPTNLVEPRWICCGLPLTESVGRYGCANCGGKNKPKPRWSNQTDSGQNRLTPSEDRWKLRSTTYQGIAEAMAAQWGNSNESGEAP
jgi:hypothetical protein